MNVEKAEEYIIRQLGLRLSETLYYHGLHHVEDVTHAVLNLAVQEGITDEQSVKLLRIAALYHDCGFMNTYQNHEEEGCRIAREILPDFGFSKVEIASVCGMIMATKIPQNPQNHLEEIICDADLDYLGRDDFEPIAETLFQELKVRQIVADRESWNQIQVKFLTAHHYWTQSATRQRAPKKAVHLENLIKLI
ncbi:HD domain-containing protein [Dyadobacter sediminis]|uniref:HD domain-containing protein n=1 Tax=Dyadobacter sediminis TaxID=1493691 RepID=A0A5R9KI55_9BACT|nr:HD domain-containing protein [Dyadobacter sediminis]TLU95789.1 HD domain-containing protein [Dyadobacter sediminis]GGB76568.1 hypothetical protein GCM10011325_00090 [Dyadobacter sediminis]